MFSNEIVLQLPQDLQQRKKCHLIMISNEHFNNKNTTNIIILGALANLDIT